MKHIASRRIGQMGSAIFAEMARCKQQAAAAGLDIIDLGIGSPDRPPSPNVMQALANEALNPKGYGYPSSEGSPEFRCAAAEWLKHRFSVELDPEHEVLALMGSQEGLAHLALAVTDPGDTAIVPDPGYPIYSAGLVMAGLKSYALPLTASNGFLPKFEDIPAEIAHQAKFILLNYPSNPLSAVADEAFFRSLVDFANQTDTLIVHDLAYSEMAFDGFRPRSVLQTPGALERAVEFHSLSKSFNMAGCRIAFLAGNREMVGALRDLKANIDYGVFSAVQKAGIVALQEDMAHGFQVSGIYQARRDAMIAELGKAGWHLPVPKATMFIWAPIPDGWTARQISREILQKTGVVVIPGDAFGSQGEGYVRIALVQDENRLIEAARRIGDFLSKH